MTKAGYHAQPSMFGPEQRVVFVTGKGGVGKSTVAAALARAEADRTGSAMLVELEGATAAERSLDDEAEENTRRHHRVPGCAAGGDHAHGVEPIARQSRGPAAGARARAPRCARDPRLVAPERVRGWSQRAPRAFVDLPPAGMVDHCACRLRPSACEWAGRANVPRHLDQVIAPRRSALVGSTAEPDGGERDVSLRLVVTELGRSPELVVANRVPPPLADEAGTGSGASPQRSGFGQLSRKLPERQGATPRSASRVGRSGGIAGRA
jgi:hypothetical protein